MIEIYENFEKMKLEDIKDTNCLLKQYESEISILKEDPCWKLVEDLYGESLEYIYMMLYKKLAYYRSNIFFPNQIVEFYPNIKESRAIKTTTCDFSGGNIYKGSKYLIYKPFVQNIIEKTAYVLKKPLKVEEGYYDDLPKTITELEELELKLRNYSYDKYYGEEELIRYSHLASKLDSFVFIKLRRKRNENCNS